MMKIEHVNEAVELQRKLKVIEYELTVLDKAECLQVNWYNRSVTVKRYDFKFEELRGSMRIILENQRANIIRRCNQIGLLVDPVCIVE